MEEREAIKRIKNSFRAGLSRAQILKNFQKKGYKLEYAEALIEKANRPKRIATLSIIAILLASTIILATANLVSKDQKKEDKAQKITGSSVAITKKKNIGQKVQTRPAQGRPKIPPEKTAPKKRAVLSESFITSALKSIKAQEYLHKSPFFESPKINFRLGQSKFNSVIGQEIKTSRGLISVKRIGTLEELTLRKTRIDDTGIRELAELTNLRTLNLMNTRISDVSPLVRLKKLEALQLSNTNVDDRCVDALEQLPHLRYLAVNGTRITDAGVRRLVHAGSRDGFTLIVSADQISEATKATLPARVNFDLTIISEVRENVK